MIAAGIDAVDVVQAFDEMDRNRDNLITYEEFRYYVGVVLGDSSQLNVSNFAHQMTDQDKERLEVWRQQWNKTATMDQDKITKEDAIDNMRMAIKEPMSPGLVRSLQTQMDVNGDGMIDFLEFARACDKVLANSTTSNGMPNRMQ